jgi:hypothetical protein
LREIKRAKTQRCKEKNGSSLKIVETNLRYETLSVADSPIKKSPTEAGLKVFTYGI